MNDKPLSAVDLLEDVDIIIGNEINRISENILDKLMGYELLEPEDNITLETLLREAQRLSALRAIRGCIMLKYKHVYLQD